jgi:hypothetical protein
MSAYLCDAPLLAALAREVAKRNDRFNAETVFDLLLDENLKSLSYRYPNAARIEDWYDDGEAAFIWANVPEKQYSATELLQFLDDYTYQSCEHPEWEASVACWLMCTLKTMLTPDAQREAQVAEEKRLERRRAHSALPRLEPKATAVVIRRILKTQFPATKFSVTTARGSMVSAVHIEWTDGPTRNAVGALVSGFEQGRFDGMTDSYEYDTSKVLNVEGVIYRPACEYVQTRRTISAELANQCIAQLVNYWRGIEKPAVAIQNGHYYEIADNRGREPIRPDLDHRHDWYTLIHQAAEDPNKFVRAE